jgi:hypothetical protein
MNYPRILPAELRKKLYNVTHCLIWMEDAAIDIFRKKYNIIIYHKAEPFVQPTGDEHKIMYCFAVKKCFPGEPNGWNKREYIGESKWCENIYEAKRQAIKIALRYVESRTTSQKKR